ncbi:hypothetical protein D1007_50649 [Hordeum vulgare]|nr:hypothetical protein D1007_50649 [Hordeum vulgare]
MARTQDVAAEERRVAAEERKVTLEERKVAMEERSRLLKWEKYLFFLDTSALNEVQKEYINLTCGEILIQKEPCFAVWVTVALAVWVASEHHPGGIGGMGGGGMGGMGGMNGFGAPPSGIGGMGGGGIGDMGGMDGFGAPPDGIDDM